MVGGPVGSSLAEPAAITAKRAQVAQLMGQLQVIGERAEQAAEIYNGARWRLQEINQRIRENRANLTRSTKSLTTTRAHLATRASQNYRSPRPSVSQIVLVRGSINDAVEEVRARRRIAEQDMRMVRQVAELKARIERARVQLRKDRVEARAQLRVATRQRRQVEAVLRQRQRILNAAAADLRRAVAAEQARVRRQAEIARQAALAAQRVQSSNQSSSSSSAASSAPATQSAPVSLPSGSGNAVAARAALQYLGTPYKWGGAAPGGFDCSGLANYVYAKIGKDVPHYTGAIWSKFPKVPSSSLQTGDLVFFSGGGHMGIYLGDGTFVHAPQTGDVVKISTMSSRSGSYVGAVRP